MILDHARRSFYTEESPLCPGGEEFLLALAPCEISYRPFECRKGMSVGVQIDACEGTEGCHVGGRNERR